MFKWSDYNIETAFKWIKKPQNTRNKNHQGKRLILECVCLCKEGTQTHTCFQWVSPPTLTTPLAPPLIRGLRRGPKNIIIISIISSIIIFMLNAMKKMRNCILLERCFEMFSKFHFKSFCYLMSVQYKSTVSCQRILGSLRAEENMSFIFRFLESQAEQPLNLSFTVRANTHWKAACHMNHNYSE